MAVQAQFYSENLGLLPMCLQDWEANPVYGIEDDPCFSSLPYHQQTQYQQQQSTQNLGFDCNQGASSSSTCNSFPPISLSQSLDGQLQNQRHEIDCIIQLQKEKLIHALQEQRKQQLAVLLSNLESKSKILIRQKEEDLAQATKKTMELQDCLRKAEFENETWQRLAKENEAIVADLTNTLEQVQERVVLASNRAEDAESCCSPFDRGRGKELEEVAFERQREKFVCKGCNFRNSSFVFFPCRHLCSCNFCETFFDCCPVCKSVKEGCMEVFLA